MHFIKLYGIIPLFRKRLWPLGQAAKTAPSHGAIMGSIPVGVTKKNKSTRWVLLFFCSEGIEGAEVNDSLRRLSEPSVTERRRAARIKSSHSDFG